MYIALQPDSETQLLTILLEWNGVMKSVSSTLVGLSPEFELALYRLCFCMGNENNYVELGPYLVNIKCYCLGKKILDQLSLLLETGLYMNCSDASIFHH